jgi:hypothetical protein
MKEESWRRNHEGGIMKEESLRRNLEPSGRHLEASGGIWRHLEASGRHLEASGRHLAPRRHPGGTQEAPTVGFPPPPTNFARLMRMSVMVCCNMLRAVLRVILCIVMVCYVMLCYVMSSHVMSCHVVSCHVMSCHVAPGARPQQHMKQARNISKMLLKSMG